MRNVVEKILGLFSPNTAYHCAIETLNAISELHKLGYIHRDIKPGNFVLGPKGSDRSNRVYMVDFGIARYILDEAGKMKTPRETVGYLSIKS